MKIKFTDVNDAVLDLSAMNDIYAPKGDWGDFDNNLKLLDKFGIEGSYETGDSVLKSRKATVKIHFNGESDLAYRIRFARVMNFFKPEKRPFYVVDEDNNLRARVSFNGMSVKYKDGASLRVGEASIELTMLDGLWEGDEVTYTQIAVSANTAFSFQVSAAIEVYNAYPKIKVTSSGANPDFSITNLTNNDTIRIQEVALTSGQFIEINSVDGLILYGSVLKPTAKSAGNFPRLVDGANTILYESNVAADIEIRYRPRFVI